MQFALIINNHIHTLSDSLAAIVRMSETAGVSGLPTYRAIAKQIAEKGSQTWTVYPQGDQNPAIVTFQKLENVEQ